MSIWHKLIAGGTFALYSLLCRQTNIGILPTKRMSSSGDPSLTNQSTLAEKKSKLATFLERSITARRILLFIAMLGMCMLIGDGILTPAISGKLCIKFLASFSCMEIRHAKRFTF